VQISDMNDAQLASNRPNACSCRREGGADRPARVQQALARRLRRRPRTRGAGRAPRAAPSGCRRSTRSGRPAARWSGARRAPGGAARGWSRVAPARARALCSPQPHAAICPTLPTCGGKALCSKPYPHSGAALGPAAQTDGRSTRERPQVHRRARFSLLPALHTAASPRPAWKRQCGSDGGGLQRARARLQVAGAVPEVRGSRQPRRQPRHIERPVPAQEEGKVLEQRRAAALAQALRHDRLRARLPGVRAALRRVPDRHHCSVRERICMWQERACIAVLRRSQHCPITCRLLLRMQADRPRPRAEHLLPSPAARDDKDKGVVVRLGPPLGTRCVGAPIAACTP